MRKLSLVLLISLTGCATTKISQQEQRQAYIDECGYNDHALDPIRDKVVFLYMGDSKEQSKEIKANTAYVSDAEKPVIALWIKKREACNKGEYNRFLLKNKQVVDDLLSLLYQQKITYGQFATYREHVASLALDVEAEEIANRKFVKMMCGEKE